MSALISYTYGDIEYFVDFLLEELRPQDAPHQPIQFIYLCEEDIRAELRGLRAEFGPNRFMVGLDS
ncbi:MAG: hypothetical protein DRI97_00015 [Bacteroidetes bacterium]|nr:MAG: hypothetical protein DRI97_00015 [Bacteroidota bacterium]